MGELKFQSIASGSSGNCYYIGTEDKGILIDAGIGVRTIRKSLRAIKLDFKNILAVFITHDHADHIRAIGTLGEKYNIPIFSTRKVHEGIYRSYSVTEKLYTSRKFIEKDETVEILDFKITCFSVSHDATDNVGYTVEFKEKIFTFATDLGYVCSNAAKQLRKSHYMVFESNYDVNMLKNGKYPLHLQHRISADTGHLSNDQCGHFLAEHYQEHMQYVFLCHLSKENNTPEVAFNTVKRYLDEKAIRVGEDIQIEVLDRFSPSKLYIF